jgi:hypothetical protein
MTQPPVVLSSVRVGEPIRTGWTAPPNPLPLDAELDDLADVDTTGDAAGEVLTRGSDGTWRGQPVSVPAGGYHHEQPVAATTWMVPHNLGFRPAGIVARDATSLIEPDDVTYPDVNTTALHWLAATAGSADMS